MSNTEKSKQLVDCPAAATSPVLERVSIKAVLPMCLGPPGVLSPRRFPGGIVHASRPL
jgi:hypothetical protein